MKFSTNEVTDHGLDIEGAVAHTIEFNKDVADLLSKGIYSDETRAVKEN